MGRQITESDINRAISQGKAFELHGYTLSDSLKENLEEVLGLLLGFYGRQELTAVLFAVIQELALWSSLSNMRQIFFEESDYDLADEAEMADAEARFQESLKKGNAMDYARKVRTRGLFLRIRLEHSEQGLRLQITNNAIHSVPLEDRLRRFLRQAMNYTNIMDYYQDNPDDQDGREVGFAYAILMLKDTGLRPDLMRLGQVGDVNFSRLEIPFDSSFHTIRDRIRNDEAILPFDPTQSLFPDSVAPPGVKTVICPVCLDLVDERIFFDLLAEDMLDAEKMSRHKPEWRMEDGACAACIAIHG